MSPDASLPPAYFDALYGRDPDPWGFETSAYEDAKYAATLAALDRPLYPRVLEVGCSIGVLTARLAPRAGDLIGMDVAEAALARARARLADRPEVQLIQAAFPAAAPPGPFDLIVLSEVLYYLSADDLRAAAEAVERRLAPDGQVLLVHWLGDTGDYPCTGEAASEAFLGHVAGSLTRVRGLRTPDYRLDLLARPALEDASVRAEPST